MSVLDDIARHEGFRPRPYKDTEGFLTIGYGINLNAGITQVEAMLILSYRVQVLQSKLRQRLPFWQRLTIARQDVLINMAYNLGIEGLMGFKTTLRLISEGDYDEAANQMLKSKWARQVGQRAIELSEKMRNG